MAEGVDPFLRRIASIPLLSASDERRLARGVERGEPGARDRLVEANLRLVVHLARPLQSDRHALSFMDLVQEGTVGLVRAVARFDHRRGVRFATYAAWWIRSAMLLAVREQGGAVRLNGPAARRAAELRRARAELGADATRRTLAERLGWTEREVADLDRACARGEPLSDVLADDDAPSPQDGAAREALRAPLHDALGDLPPAQRRVVELRFGLTETGPLTTREVARRLRTSAEKVRHVEDLALRRLRAHPSIGAPG